MSISIYQKIVEKFVFLNVCGCAAHIQKTACLDKETHKKRGEGKPSPRHYPRLLGNAIAFHTLQELGEIPDLLVGGIDAAGQIGRAILEI